MTEEKTEWVKFLTRPTFTPLFVEPFTQAADTVVTEVIGTAPTDHLYFSTDEGIKWYVRGNEREEFGRSIMDKIKSDKDFAKRQANECIEASEEMVDTARKMSGMDFGKKSDEALFNLFENFVSKMRDFMFYLYVIPFADKLLTKEIREGIQNILEKQEGEKTVDDYFKPIMNIQRIPESSKEEIKLLKIAKEEKSGNKSASEIERKIKEHAKKFGWMTTYAFHHSPAGEDFFKEKINEIENPGKKLEEEERKRKEAEQKFEEMIERLEPDENLENLIRTLRDYIFLRTYRTDMLRKAFYQIRRALEVIGQRIDMAREQMSYFTFSELEKALLHDDVPSHEKIDRRMEDFLILKKGDSFKVFSKENKITEIKDQELGRIEEEIETLSGNGIYGEVKEGKVKKVSGSEDKEKMEEGDILVTTMTTPDMHSLIEMSVAIVTDEGGTTSHAAMVSKELEIPTVIGTEKATKVLEDGQKVKVDAEKGVIEVLG